MRSLGGSTVILLVGGIAACGSSPAEPPGWTPGTATLEGTLGVMPARTWASAAATRPDPNQLGIVVTNIAGGTDACQAASMGPNVSSLFQVVVAITSNPMPGKYALGADWQASYRVADATCATAGEGAAISGILEIDSIDTVVHGAADMTFPAGRVLATFDAPICSPPAVATACARYPSCPAGHGADVKPPPSACLTFP